jgi:D-serine deaminase-like pyridoxal phosphate-dependent protein
MSGFMSAVGRSKQELDTPSLVVDLPKMERNIVRMTERIIGYGVNWRPHTKGQKVPAIAHQLLRAGAIGVTCAKLGEAEVMAAAGIQDILIANQIVGPEKIARLVNLRRQADVIVAVDSPENVAELSAAASARGVQVRIVVEVDLGMHRCGVPTPEAAVALAGQVANAPGLKFAGVEGWEAPCTRISDPAEKRACVEAAIGLLLDAANRCRAAGLPVDIVSCGGTGTYWITATIPGVTEVQAGGGIFSDVVYQEQYGLDHELALTMMTTVISRPAPTRIILDAGKKTYSSDSAAPRALGVEGVTSTSLSAEHTRLELSAPNTSLKVGDRLEFVVGYSDTTMHLHDELFGVRDGIVETAWPILGRGKLR